MTSKFIDDDFVVVRREAAARSKRMYTLAFGDEVEILDDRDPDWTQVRIASWLDGSAQGFIRAGTELRDDSVLRLSMVDVQQGDGLVLESPSGQIVLIDGGENKLYARHLAERFRHRHPTDADPLEVAAIIVTHGDGDHFDGLNDIRRSEALPAAKAEKRLPIHPQRVFHNGIVKLSGTGRSNDELLGATVEHDRTTYLVDLYDDPREAPFDSMNEPFKRWSESLDHWEQRGPIDLKRVEFGSNPGQLFDFLATDGIGVEIQGPFATTIPDPAGGGDLRALRFLHKPPHTPEIHLELGSAGEGALSASHTINGHSIALRLTYGNVRFSFTGDLNQEAMAIQRSMIPLEEFEAEILKAPHHGSHEFDLAALEAIRPIVAIVSSGDEREFVEYIHPRATLMSALGQSMRGDTGVILCTELAAFFKMREECYTRDDLAAFFGADPDAQFTGEELRKLFSGAPTPQDPPSMFFGFERTNFGIIHVRTDGERVLVFTHSGRRGLNEAYRFRVTKQGDQRVVRFEEVTTS